MERTVLKNRIIFVLLFVFSFIIVHDTVLDVLQSEHETCMAKVSQPDVEKKVSQPLPHLHSMFHFVALIESEYPVLEALQREVSIAPVLLAYLYFDIEEDDRPPIL